jgi:hypothetical protein
MTRLRFCWSSRTDTVFFSMSDILYYRCQRDQADRMIALRGFVRVQGAAGAATSHLSLRHCRARTA